jgi:hypothetical protein
MGGVCRLDGKWDAFVQGIGGFSHRTDVAKGGRMFRGEDIIDESERLMKRSISPLQGVPGIAGFH